MGKSPLPAFHYVVTYNVLQSQVWLYVSFLPNNLCYSDIAFAVGVHDSATAGGFISIS